MPRLANFGELVKEMVDTYKAYVEERPNMKFLRHPSDLSNYAYLKIDKASTSNFSFFKRRLTQFLNDPYSEIAKKLLVSSTHGILKWMTKPPPVDRNDQTPADIVNWDLTQTFFRADFGGFDYVGSFDADFRVTKKGEDQREQFQR